MAGKRRYKCPNVCSGMQMLREWHFYYNPTLYYPINQHILLMHLSHCISQQLMVCTLYTTPHLPLQLFVFSIRTKREKQRVTQKEEYLFKWKYEQTFTYWLIHTSFKLTWVNSVPALVFPATKCLTWSACYVFFGTCERLSHRSRVWALCSPVGAPVFMNPTNRPLHGGGFAQTVVELLF